MLPCLKQSGDHGKITSTIHNYAMIQKCNAHVFKNGDSIKKMQQEWKLSLMPKIKCDKSQMELTCD